MSEYLVPVKIRKHLVPFFYKEFEGIEATALGKKVKACKITYRSSLGYMILTAMQATDAPVEPGKYYVWISFTQEDLESSLFKAEKGKNNFLKVPDQVNEKINNLLEDQFRLALYYQIKGMLKGNPELMVKDAIGDFMVEYELDDFGFELESIRRLFDRTKENPLSRFQIKSSNRVHNYNP